MPKPGYSGKLTCSEIIDLFRKGRYSCDPEKGLVFSSKGKPLYTFTNKRFTDNWKGQKWVRLYDAPRMRSLPVSHVIWMWSTMRAIPPGFEIHHRNLDSTDDSWLNLYCLYEDDHRKLHGQDILERNGHTQETHF